jgi:hypothetical protein
VSPLGSEAYPRPRRTKLLTPNPAEELTIFNNKSAKSPPALEHFRYMRETNSPGQGC